MPDPVRLPLAPQNEVFRTLPVPVSQVLFALHHKLGYG
jgi:hypothetical protein